MLQRLDLANNVHSSCSLVLHRKVSTPDPLCGKDIQVAIGRSQCGKRPGLPSKRQHEFAVLSQST